MPKTTMKTKTQKTVEAQTRQELLVLACCVAVVVASVAAVAAVGVAVVAVEIGIVAVVAPAHA